MTGTDERAFADAENLDPPPLSDSDGSVSEAYGVLYDEFNRHRRVAKHSVFVVDQNRTVRYAWATDDRETIPDWIAVRNAFEETPTLPSGPSNEFA